MKPFVFASHFEAFCGIRVEEKCDRNVAASGPAWLGAPRKPGRELGCASEPRVDDGRARGDP
jgi:hypothetical protein